MKQFLTIFICLLFTLCSAKAVIVNGGIEYNQEIAAEEVFREPFENINYYHIASHFIDSGYEENISALKSGITDLKDRKVGKFSDGTYGVMYYADPLYDWYYNSNGRLKNFTKKNSLEYPIKITKYKPDGSIANTGLKVSENESFIFSPNGKLIAHWKGNLCFDEANNIIMTRKNVE